MLRSSRFNSHNIRSLTCQVRQFNQQHQQQQPDQQKTATNVANIKNKPNWVPFHTAKYGHYKFDPPVLENQFTGNAFLKAFLKNHMPIELYEQIEPDLTQFGHRVATDVHKLALECEYNKPYLRSNGAWGDYRNELIVTDAWNKQKDISAQEGLIAIGYNRQKYSQWARLYQYAKLYLYAPSSGMFGCPLAMTDGAAKSFEELNLLDNRTFANAFAHLTSTDPAEFWTSGQWMTEKGGGSDVAGGTETAAVRSGSDSHKLYGVKWFSSATDANMALTLARIADPEGNVIKGTRGLTLFYVPVKENGGAVPDSVHLIRLKDKMGTRQLPTAELLLDGAKAMKISEEGRGIASISHMLQVTRIHNSISCGSAVQRIVSLARDYAHRREAFGKRLIDIPLHAQTLARLDMIAKAQLMLSFENVRLLGLIESGEASDQEKMVFRILNPLAKLWTGKLTVPAISEGLECIGGQAIMEDSGIPYLLRDAQILVTWEGTTNVLSMDVLRSIIKSNGETVFALRAYVKSKLERVLQNDKLVSTAQKILDSLDEMIKIAEKRPQALEVGGRDFSMSLANLYVGALLLENTTLEHQTLHSDNLALRFCNTQDLTPFLTNDRLGEYSSRFITMNHALATECYEPMV